MRSCSPNFSENTASLITVRCVLFTSEQFFCRVKNFLFFVFIQALLNLSVDPFVGVADIAKKIVNGITLKVRHDYKWQNSLLVIEENLLSCIMVRFVSKFARNYRKSRRETAVARSIYAFSCWPIFKHVTRIVFIEAVELMRLFSRARNVGVDVPRFALRKINACYSG